MPPKNYRSRNHQKSATLIPLVGASLIIGDSAIEIQEVDSTSQPPPTSGQQVQQNLQQVPHERDEPSIILGSTGGSVASLDTELQNQAEAVLQGKSGGHQSASRPSSSQMSRPLPPILSGTSRDTQPGGANNQLVEWDITDGDKKSRGNHDYDLNELNSARSEKNALRQMLAPGAPATDDHQEGDGKTIAGKVVDFELTPAGGHNKAKIKKKKKKKEKKAEEMFKKWGKKKKEEKMAEEKEQKEHMKKKKEEGKKGKKKWGHEEHGQKKKGKFKKKKWGKKVKKGKGVKKGKKGKKSLMDKGHKNTGFKTVYHKEEWGKSSKWHDIKREKKWDEKSKKWKKKWKKEKGKKYKGDHMKKFEKKKKEGKKYKKENVDKFKKFKKEKFEKGKKKKMEAHAKKSSPGDESAEIEINTVAILPNCSPSNRKEGGAKKEMKKKEMKKKKKKKKKG